MPVVVGTAPDGALRRFPEAWTDLRVADAFEIATQGRFHFRPADLLALADLLAELREGPSRV